MIHIHEDFVLELRDRIHLYPFQVDSIQFLYNFVVSPIEDWKKNIQSGVGNSCALAHEDCLNRRKTVSLFVFFQFFIFRWLSF